VSKRLPLVWTKHLKSAKEKEDFESLLRNSTQVLRRLKQVLEEKEADLAASQMKLEDYDSPSWAYKEAHRHGRQAELKFLKEIIDFIN
jgi:hypothetical protein